jgi:hypothetical protein
MRMSRKEEKTKKKTREGLHKYFASHRIKNLERKNSEIAINTASAHPFTNTM